MAVPLSISFRYDACTVLTRAIINDSLISQIRFVVYFTKVRVMQAVILCGGLAVRLGSLTEGCPRSMLQVCGRSFFGEQIQGLEGSCAQCDNSRP